MDKRSPITVTAYGSPEFQHSKWDPTFENGGSSSVWNTTVGPFLKVGLGSLVYYLKQGFCLSCHNSASVAHDKALQGKNHYMTLPVVHPSTIVCTTCHSTLTKTADYGRVWEMTTTSDRITYTLQRGGWSYAGNLVPVVYRDTSLRTGPTYSRDRKQYMVDPSEYNYDENTGTITFIAQQDPAAYIYVTLDYPYLVKSSQDNKLCTTCHTQATHKGENCLDCHSAHNTGNIKDVRKSVRTPNLSTVTVKFLNYTKANSFADGNSTRDGICEVCHTTTRYYRRDGSGFANHSGGINYDGKNCMTCHAHSTGFAR